MTTPVPPTLYQPRYGASVEVSLIDLRAAYEMAARLVATHGDAYLSLFERLDQEIQRHDHAESVRQRALAVAGLPAADRSRQGPG